MENNTPWSVPVAVEDIPETGLHLEIEAPEAAQKTLCKLANLRSVQPLSAVFDLTPRGAGVHVLGRVKARVGQTCVVSLEPLESDVEEPIDLLFVPNTVVTGTEALLSAADADEESPELLVNGKVDVGAVATEFLLLGIDPYPRKPGVTFSAPKTDEDAAHPFASLAALKKQPGGSQP